MSYTVALKYHARSRFGERNVKFARVCEVESNRSFRCKIYRR